MFKPSTILQLKAGAPIWLKVMVSIIILVELTLVTQRK